MNERLFRTQFNQMDTTEKQALMESLAARYDMTFLGLHTFDRWGQNCTTGIFKKDGREFVFVPGDTVTLGWEQFAVGLNQESREELEYLFREWEMEPQNPEEMIRESMAPVRQAAIGPMLVLELGYSVDYEDEKEDFEPDDADTVELINGGRMSWEQVKRDGIDYIALYYVNEKGKPVQILDAELA